MDGLNSNGKPGMYYIDSFANTMPAQIDELIKKFSGESEDVLGDTMTLAHNKRSFQKNNYACGYYCMHFIEHMIQGNSFADYKALPPTDKMMEEYSLQCFIHPDMMV